MKKILLLGTEGPGGGDEILLHPRGERYFAGAGRKPMIDKNGATAWQAVAPGLYYMREGTADWRLILIAWNE